MVTAGGAASPAAMATPMNGAVQGVATTTASRPVKKLPVWPGRAARPWPVCIRPVPISNTPDRLRPTANSSQVIAATNTGDWNWNPQPAAVPAARTASRAAQSPANAASTPAV